MDDFKLLLQSALKILAIRNRSRKEIVDYLNKKTRNQDLTNQVINKLTELGLVNDAKFSQWLIESRSRSRPRGKRLLVQELKAKGVDPTTYNLQLTTQDEVDLACKALQKKAKSWSNLSAKDYQLKAKSYLYARGFPWSAIEAAIKKGYNELHVS